MARMMPTSRDYILSKYKLHQLKAIEDFVAEAVEVNPHSVRFCHVLSCKLTASSDQRAI